MLKNPGKHRCWLCGEEVAKRHVCHAEPVYVGGVYKKYRVGSLKAFKKHYEIFLTNEVDPVGKNILFKWVGVNRSGYEGDCFILYVNKSYEPFDSKNEKYRGELFSKEMFLDMEFWVECDLKDAARKWILSHIKEIRDAFEKIEKNEIPNVMI